MRILGLTGGIASGKTTVASFLQTELHIPVIDCDLIARKVVEPGRPAYQRILKTFGMEILKKDGSQEIDRACLGDRIFADPALRRQLNACTHPYIRLGIVKEIIWYWLQGYKLVVLDAPLLLESGLDRFFWPSMVVYCPEDLQLERFSKRNPELSTEQLKLRITSQMPLSEKCTKVKYIIDNSGPIASTHQQVRLIIQQEMPHFLSAYWFHGVLIGIGLALGRLL